MKTSNLMPHNDDRFRFPTSRDFYLDWFVYKAVKCVGNKNGLCFTPALCKIGEDGKCENYKEKSND